MYAVGSKLWIALASASGTVSASTLASDATINYPSPLALVSRIATVDTALLATELYDAHYRLRKLYNLPIPPGGPVLRVVAVEVADLTVGLNHGGLTDNLGRLATPVVVT